MPRTGQAERPHPQSQGGVSVKDNGRPADRCSEMLGHSTVIVSHSIVRYRWEHERVLKAMRERLDVNPDGPQARSFRTFASLSAGGG
ncbi:hypothetical protein PMI02_01688, partial [Novosphingobium sp. AP12]